MVSIDKPIQKNPIYNQNNLSLATFYEWVVVVVVSLFVFTPGTRGSAVGFDENPVMLAEPVREKLEI